MADEQNYEKLLSETFKAEQFIRWAKDENGAYPFATTFDKWEEAGLVQIAEEGYALTTLGRRVAGLPVGPDNPMQEKE